MRDDSDSLRQRISALEQQVADLKKRGYPYRGIRKRSSRSFWGLPLYDIAMGPDLESGEMRGHARGIIAVGDIATGVLALGGIARGLIAVGGLAAGAAATVWGPGFDIDDGSYFSVDAYAFPTVEAAGDFLRATEAQVVGCTSPATYQQPESEFDMLEDGTGDAAMWTFVEMPTSTYAVTTEADDLLQVPMDILVSTQADGTDFSLTITNHVWYERHGNIVLTYMLEGWWGFSQGGDPDWAFQPTTEATGAASAVVRTQIVMRLTEMGVL